MSVDFGVDLSLISAALFIDTREQPSHNFSISVISELYGLTHAEARLSAALANGYALEEIAEKRKVSMATIRSQLKACFRKTGVSRQVDLVKLILSGPAVLVNSTDLGKSGNSSDS
jgi:DNA-binding CsgD family transcriptional regulator